MGDFNPLIAVRHVRHVRHGVRHDVRHQVVDLIGLCGIIQRPLKCAHTPAPVPTRAYTSARCMPIHSAHAAHRSTGAGRGPHTAPHGIMHMPHSRGRALLFLSSFERKVVVAEAV